MKRQCCKCRRYARGAEWILQADNTADNVTHTYCPECLKQERRSIRDRARARATFAQASYGT